MKKEARRQRQQQRASTSQARRTKYIVIAVLAFAATAWALTSFAPPPAAAEPAAATGFQRMSIQDAKALFDRGAVTMIDVRDAADYASAHIPGALQIPLARIEAEIPYLPKDKAIVTYCTCPNEESSGAAVEILAHAGISNAWALHGGLVPWRKHGYPVESGSR
jgi:rhodanese-related sulfurtransferase